MSRIHDALKRAEQEKSTQKPPSDQAMSSGLSFGTEGVDVFTSQVPVQANVGTGPVRETRTSAASGVQYEELIRRCAHPQWKNSAVATSPTDEPGKIAAERFRTLRSRLYQIAALRPLRRVLITSSLPGEGKTFVATNLARSIIRQADRRVLIIDGDLRAPRLNTALGAPSSPGLSDYLRGEANHYSIVQNSAANNLCFVACGTRVSNPSELLLSDRMAQLLDTLAPAFDWVILDSPPSLPVHDASNLAGLCDGVLFVVHAGKTDNEVALKASAEFRDKNLLGVVLNRVEASETQGGYYYGQADGK
jgi:protein-tyrosine kinase